MNLSKLFEAQKKLDDRIVEEKGLQGQDLLDEKILALQVELGELANEWRGFKFWSENQKPTNPYNKGCENCVGGISKTSSLYGPYKECEYCRVNPLLEEYVDCLHFILSIGNDLKCSDLEPYLVKVKKPIKMFTSIYFNITKIANGQDNLKYKRFYYAELLSRFFGLGKSLEFTWSQIEQAYFEKNEINHERQASGY